MSRPTTTSDGRQHPSTAGAALLGVLTAGVAGLLAVGLPAAPARAAAAYQPPTADQLSQLRQCESSGNYAIDTGNGYYGAYQFADGTWAAYRTNPAEQHASDGSPAEQDDAASRLWQDRGTAPWPGCTKSRNLVATPVGQSPSPSPTIPPPSGDASADDGRYHGVAGRPAGVVGHQADEGRPPVASGQTAVASGQSAVASGQSAAVSEQSPAASDPTSTGTSAVTAAGDRPDGTSAKATPAAPAAVPSGRTRPAGPAGVDGGHSSLPFVVTPVAHPAYPGTVLSTALANQTRADVKTWQQRMKDRGWTLDVDGQFGAQSRDVAASFSQTKGVVDTVPGEVGQTVWDAAWTYPVR